MSSDRKTNLVKNITSLIDLFVAAEKSEYEYAIQEASDSISNAFDALYELPDLVESARSFVEDAKECLRDIDG